MASYYVPTLSIRAGPLRSSSFKVYHFEVPGGKVCFALSGASALAWSAIQKCRKQLQAAPSNDLVADIETILDAEYRRNVLGHPNYTDFDYSLLLGIWMPNERPRLYFTTATAITEVKEFQCIGIGGELASYLIRPGFYGLTLTSAVALAAYTLGSVKDSITGCGGMSIYVLLRNDGTVGVLTIGTTTLFAALELLQGKVIGQCYKRHRHQEFLRFLRHLDREFPQPVALHLVLDNYGTHGEAEVQAWLKKHSRFVLHFVPTSSSWLNLVERWFRELTSKRIRRDSFLRVPDLIAAIEQFLEVWNENPQPFVWTATVESIVAKLSGCRQTLERIQPGCTLPRPRK